MTSLIAYSTLLCSVCQELIDPGSPVVLVDDEFVHEECEL